MSRKIYYNLELNGAHDSFVFEVDDAQYDQVSGNLIREEVDLDQALETAVAMLSANVRMHDDSLTQDVLDAQMVATATIWFLFNEAADEDDRVQGDVLLVEQDGELFITEVEIEEPEEPEDED
jgi:hypothetical protein